MPLYTLTEFADIKKIPNPRAKNCQFEQTTVGDMHGNAMKFIYALIECGLLVNFSEENYKILWEIYDTKPEELTEEQLLILVKIITDMQFTKTSATEEKIQLRLLGDLLSDRGMNDFYILLIFMQLHLAQVNFEIVISNHDFNFLLWFFNQDLFVSTILDTETTTRSLNNLRVLIERKLVEMSTIDYLVKTCYLPYLKVFSCSLDESNLVMYSHAPVGFETFKAVTGQLWNKEMQSELKEKEDVELLEFGANLIFKEYLKGDYLRLLYYNNQHKSLDMNAFKALIWNTKMDHPDLQWPTSFDELNSFFVHGHHSRKLENHPLNVITLDTKFGKGDSTDIEKYTLWGVSSQPLGYDKRIKQIKFNAASFIITNQELNLVNNLFTNAEVEVSNSSSIYGSGLTTFEPRAQVLESISDIDKTTTSYI